MNYLLDDQLWAGRSLVGLALLLTVVPVLALCKRSLRSESGRAGDSPLAGMARRACNSSEVGTRSLP